MTSAERHASLNVFVAYAQMLKGDEKGEAQIFLDRLFQAFGHGGIKEAGASCEERIKKADAGGTAFADLVWKPVVLIEMKKRGADLTKHYRQAFDYWTRLVPGRPRYAVLCNFDEFRIYDFETQMDAPVDVLRLDELPHRPGPLNFLRPGGKPTFQSDRVAVTRQAADSLAACFNQMVKRGVERATAQRFILQMLVALFAEDIGLLDKYFVTNLLGECATPAQSFDLIGGLFAAMNTQHNAGGRFKGVPYFNGGLFMEPARVEITDTELVHLRQASTEDWSLVQPEIFGTLFQHSMQAEERHAFGAHFTHPADIMKIVGPTIVAPWREQIEGAKTLKRLSELLDRMHHYQVLDPACGSGNFLYIAYRELKRLEARIFERIDAEFPSRAAGDQMRLSYLSAQNFHGLDINPFAIEIAKVTMMIARKLAIDELHISERALPLDNLDANFVTGDALLNGATKPTNWPKADVIIGNPPFLGAKHLKPEHGTKYIDALREAYPDVPGLADYCVYWFRKAHDHLPSCTPTDPLAGRAGLVGTQNIRNNQSRVGGLDHIATTGTIIEAVDNQPWSGEANVHVSIANWMKTQDRTLLPAKRVLWFKAKPAHDKKKNARDFDLDFRTCSHISSSLSDQADLSTAAQLRGNCKPQRIYRGLEPGNMGFLVAPKEAIQMIATDLKNLEVLSPYLNGRELVSGDGLPDRWLIDFQRKDLFEAMAFREPFAYVKKEVLPQMQRISEQGKGTDGAGDDDFGVRMRKRKLVSRLDHWWHLRRCVPDTVRALAALPRYIACSMVTKRPIFVFLSSRIRPSNLLQSFAFADDYSFGILQSGAHWQWFVAKCSKMNERPRYTPETIFDTFPWPQKPKRAHIETVAKAAVALRRVRREAIDKLKCSLRNLYRIMEENTETPLRDAHDALDAAVREAYGMPKNADVLQFLLDLNHACAAREKAGEKITPPGLPLPPGEHAGFITTDCIRAPDGADPGDGSTAASYASAAHYYDPVLHEEPPGKSSV